MRRYQEAEHWRQAPEPRDHDAGDFDLSRLVTALWLRKWTILIAAGSGVLIAAWHVERETPLYTATAEIVLKTSQENVIDLEGVLSPPMMVDYGTINTEREVLQGRELMARVVDALALHEDPEFNPSLQAPYDPSETTRLATFLRFLGRPSSDPSTPRSPVPPDRARDQAIDILGGKVSATHVNDTYIYQVRVVTTSPARSATIANKMAELYVEGQREAKLEALAGAMEWLSGRAVKLKDELEAAESRIESFVAGAHLVSAETLTLNTNRLKTMRDRLAEQGDLANEIEYRIGQMEESRGGGEFAALAGMIGDPLVRREARELANGPADALAVTRFDALFGTMIDGMRIAARDARTQADEVEKAMAVLKAQVDAQSADLVTLRQLKREAEAARLIYESFLNRLKELSVQQGIQQADSRILSNARIPGAPSYPDKNGTILKGGVIGLVLGIALVFAQNALRNTFRSPEDIEAITGLTVIGVIPDNRTKKAIALLRQLIEKSNSSLAESVRNLRTAINLSNVDMPPQVIIVTSSVPDEGKTILASMLAATSGMAGKRVLLIEADLRRRNLKRCFNVGSDAGLVDLLSGAKTFEAVVHHDDRFGLDVLIADDRKVTPADFFESNQFARFIADMRERYDLVILDTPPILAVPDARIIAQQADAIVYVVRWDKTTRRMVQSGLELLRQVNLRVTGAVLTRVDPRRMDLYGYYGYGYRGRGLQKYYSN